MLPHSSLLRFYIAGKFPMFIVWVNERNVKKNGGAGFVLFRDGAEERPLFFLVVLPKPVTGIAFEGTRRTGKGISVKYAALLTGARQGGTTRCALHKPLAGNILQQAPILARSTRHILWGALFWYCYQSLLQALPLRGRGVQGKKSPQSTPLCLRARGREGQRDAPSISPLQAISCNRLRFLRVLRGNRALPGHPLCQREYSPLRENAFAHEVSRL